MGKTELPPAILGKNINVNRYSFFPFSVNFSFLIS